MNKDKITNSSGPNDDENLFSLDKFEPKDYQSDIAKFNLLKTLNNYANVSANISNFKIFPIFLVNINQWVRGCVLAYHQFENARRWAFEQV